MKKSLLWKQKKKTQTEILVTSGIMAHTFNLRSLESGAGEVALQSHVYTDLPGDLSWIRSLHAWLITTPCNYSPVWFNFLFWPLLAPLLVYTSTYVLNLK